MIEILESAKQLVAMKISGSITAEDIEKAYKATEEALASNERVSFFAEVDDSVGLTIEGAVKDLWNGIGQICKLKKYYRAAVVTDVTWLASVARAEGLFFSSIDIRVFKLDEYDKAFAWASEKPEPLPGKPGPSVHLLHTTNEKVFAYEVDGPIHDVDVKTVLPALNEKFDAHEKINVLVRMKNWAGFELTAVLNDELFKTKYKALSKVDRYAVVGPKPWMRNFLELIDPLFSTKTRVFDAGDEEAAWEWVGASQALLPE